LPLAFSQNGGLPRFKMRLSVKNPDKATQGFDYDMCICRLRVENAHIQGEK